MDVNAEKDFILDRYINKTFSINEPGIIFIGLIAQSIIPIITIERQAIIAKEFINRDILLPSKEEMMNDLEKELQINEENGNPKSKFFTTRIKDGSFAKFNEDLCKMTKTKVDTDIIEPSVIRFIQEFYKLLAQSNSFAVKYVDFDNVFAGFEFKLTSELF